MLQFCTFAPLAVQINNNTPVIQTGFVGCGFNLWKLRKEETVLFQLVLSGDT